MSFIERFQGKISKVQKKGLKQTLFRINKLNENPQSGAFNQSTRSYSIDAVFLKTPYTARLRRTQSVRTQNPLGYHSDARNNNLNNSNISSPTRIKIPNIKQTFNNKINSRSDRYIDQMLQRHKNLLQLIDKKTNWKEGKK